MVFRLISYNFSRYTSGYLPIVQAVTCSIQFCSVFFQYICEKICGKINIHDKICTLGVWIIVLTGIKLKFSSKIL